LFLEIFFRGVEPDGKSAAAEFGLIKTLQIVLEDSLSFLDVLNGPSYRVSDSMRVLKFIAWCINEGMDSKVR
jgi:hypothetical protein